MHRIGLESSSAERRHGRGGVPFSRAAVFGLAAFCLSACYVVPKDQRPVTAAVAIRSSSFMGLKFVAAASEIPGQVPTGRLLSVARCRAASAPGSEVTVELLSYEEPPPAWCERDQLARTFAAVLAQIHFHTGVSPPIHKLTVRVLPADMRYRRTHWSIGRQALHLDIALSRQSAVQMRRMLDLPADSPESSENHLLQRSFVRLIAHELFHQAVAFSGRRFGTDFQTRYADELAAYLVEPCVELEVIGDSRGGQYHGMHRGFQVEGYAGERDPQPSAPARLTRTQQTFAATVLAAIRSEKLLDDITGGRPVARDSAEAQAVFATCRKAVQDFLDKAR